MNTLTDKLYCAGYGSVVFLVASLPQLYDKTNSYFNEQGSCPTYKSRLLHTLIFFALVLLTMKYLAKSNKSLQVLSKYSLFGALLFFLLSSPEAYRTTNGIYAGLADSNNGCPTMTGLIIHTVLFGAALFGMMYLPDA